jgi:hypothetical protein
VETACFQTQAKPAQEFCHVPLPGGEETGEGGPFFAPVPGSLGEGGNGVHILTRFEEICLTPPLFRFDHHLIQ